MPLPIYRLRRLLAATAVLLVILVLGMYFYARSKTKNVLKTIPGKIAYGIKSTANGYQYSKSDGGRTVFTVQASDLKEFKLNDNAELHNVNIVLYGRDSSRFDQIYGDDFAFNEKTGDVAAKGEVQIDLVANPSGAVSPDQATPKELKNPIHLKTRDLVFNKNSGDASTDARVEFRTPQASGWAVGVRYAGKSNTVTLLSQVHVVTNSPDAAVIEAERGVITNDPRNIVLERPHLAHDGGTVQADRATLYLSAENHIERLFAEGNVVANERSSKERSSNAKSGATAGKNGLTGTPEEIHARSNQAEFFFVSEQDTLRTATMTGNVHVEQTGDQPIQADAGRAILDFAGQNQLQKVHAVDGARLFQKAVRSNTSGKNSASNTQDFELTAPTIDFTVADGNVLRYAETAGAAQITITQTTQPKAPEQKTVITAGKFNANFAALDGKDHLVSMHGAPDARIVNSVDGQPDRVSTSDSIDAAFLPQGGIDSVTQNGNVVYTDNQAPDKRMQAWAMTAHYTPSDQMLVLSGNPRITNGPMATTAKTIRINRATGDAVADTDVKSTYSDVKEQPDGALLASSSPIHVTSRSMTAHNSPAIAVYTGNARLWQDTNVIEAPTIQFDRDHRSVVAQGTPAQPAQTVLVQSEKSASQPNAAGNSKPLLGSGTSPVAVTALKLTYTDSERKVHYDGGVSAKGADFTATSKSADAYLLPRSQTATGRTAGAPAPATPGQLDHMVAQGDVLIQQPNRRATGQTLVYTAADEKFVLTGGPPSIFDAEQGKITGVSLTFFRRDDRVLVEGEASSPVPVETSTRVAQ